MAFRAEWRPGGRWPARVPALANDEYQQGLWSGAGASDVDFEVYSGEVVGLVGDNGAGKSTLIKAISGVNIPDTGEIFVNGQRAHISSPADATHHGIETVYQDLALCDNLDVVNNLYLGRERYSASLGPLSPSMRTRDGAPHRRGAAPARRQVPSVRVPVASLSGGQRQSIAVAKTILRNAQVVQLDEPTAALGVAQTRQVLMLISRLREQGLAVVVISHNLADVFEVVDRVVVMRLGRRIATFDVHTTTPEQVVASDYGRGVR